MPGDPDSARRTITEQTLQQILERLSALERQIAVHPNMEAHNRELRQVLLARERELADKECVIAQLNGELIRQQSAFAEQMATQQQLLAEQERLLEKKNAEELARVRERQEKQLALERELYLGKMQREQERFAGKLSECARQESFWSRLVRMLTWS